MHDRVVTDTPTHEQQVDPAPDWRNAAQQLSTVLTRATEEREGVGLTISLAECEPKPRRKRIAKREASGQKVTEG